jgi:C4-dicarboxylate-specific signal transduction histidine kinase
MNKPVILVVDDEEINVNYVANILSDDYDIRVAYSGKMALNILNKIDIDLILLDIKMPQMDGYEVAEVIVNDTKLKEIPFIFLTSKIDEESIISGFKKGAKDYISKPFNSEVLKVRVANHVQTYFLQKKLQKMVDEQTKEILEQKEEIFIQKKKSAMGELISIIAHQLKQPLNGISISMDVINEMYKFGDLDEDLLEHQKGIIDKQVAFMAESIDDLRNFFRKDKVSKVYIIEHALSRVLAIINGELRNNNICIQKNIDEEIKINGFENELQQVLINLISNAKDAFIENNIEDRKLGINAYKEEKDIFIEVFDNAGGIPENIIDSIFESYFTTKGEKGTGIGLNLSRMIIKDSMNGELSVKNENDGVKFTIRLVDNIST